MMSEMTATAIMPLKARKKYTSSLVRLLIGLPQKIDSFGKTKTAAGFVRSRRRFLNSLVDSVLQESSIRRSSPRARPALRKQHEQQVMNFAGWGVNAAFIFGFDLSGFYRPGSWLEHASPVQEVISTRLSI